MGCLSHACSLSLLALSACSSGLCASIVSRVSRAGSCLSIIWLPHVSSVPASCFGSRPLLLFFSLFAPSPLIGSAQLLSLSALYFPCSACVSHLPGSTPALRSFDFLLCCIGARVVAPRVCLRSSLYFSFWEAFLCRGNPPPFVLCRWPSRVPCDPRLWLLAGFSLLSTAVVLLFAASVYCSFCFLVHVGGLLVLVRSPTFVLVLSIAPLCGFLMLSRSALCRLSASHGLSLSYRLHDFPTFPTHP